LCAFAAAACALFVTPSFELDLNSFRVQHGRPPLSQSIRLTSAAYSHAQSVSQYDNVSITRAFGNAWMCLPDPPPKCRLWLHNVIRMWARSGAHRANMLRRGVTSYGLTSADGAHSKRY